MIGQIKILMGASICNFFNINVARYSKDKKKRAGIFAVAASWGVLALMLCFYVGLGAYAYVWMGFGEILPVYLTVLASVLIFFFGSFRAGSTIFAQNSYDMLCSLPVSKTAIVISRVLGMYVAYLLLALLVLLPGLGVYAGLLRPPASFYLRAIPFALCLPLLPMAGAILFGAVVTGVSARMKHKSLVATVLTILLVAALTVGGGTLSIAGDSMEFQMTEEMFLHVSGTVRSAMAKLYPPAVWAERMLLTGDVSAGICYIGASLASVGIVLAAVIKSFPWVMKNLRRTETGLPYQMGTKKERSPLKTLFVKEWKRYTASTAYVVNTIMGPVMMLLLAGSIFFVGAERITELLFMPEELVLRVLPFLLAAASCMMTTTATSISLEGKQWWLIRSLPVSSKDVFTAKVLLNLAVIAPFYLASEVLLFAAFLPAVSEAFWLLVLPPVLMTFACVFGITVNLRFPVFDWDQEVTIVKQSASAFLGGIGGCLLILACAVPVFLTPPELAFAVRLIVGFAALTGTLLLYQKNARVRLTEVE